MKLLAISEHYYPRVAGTVNYVHETLSALSQQGVTVELLVPGPEPEHWQPDGMVALSYSVNWVDAGYPALGDPSRDQRYTFCKKVDHLVTSLLSGRNRPDVVHVLFGLFVMEVLNTGVLRVAGLPSLATVHNVPPMECRQIASYAALHARMKEAFRLSAVRWKNRIRLRRHLYDRYIVPSQQVHELLTPLVQANVVVIGHGFTSDLQSLMSPPASRRPVGPVHLLTAGGYAPHKRQHIIPEVAESLRATGLAFRWDVVGPPGRVPGYYDAIKREIVGRGLADQIMLHEAVPFADLARYYDQAHLYVQPSIEEGFCLTGLDAAAVGLPVIGSRAGALPDIVEVSGGVLVASNPPSVAAAISDFKKLDRWGDAGRRAAAVCARFSWQVAAQSLCAQYEALVAGANSLHG